MKSRSSLSPGAIVGAVVLALLFIGMAVGLIVTSVLWRQAVDASQVVFINNTVLIPDISSPHFIDVGGNIGSVLMGLQSFIEVYPTYYTVTIGISGLVIPNATGAYEFKIVDAVPPAYPLPRNPYSSMYPIASGQMYDNGSSEFRLLLLYNSDASGTVLDFQSATPNAGANQVIVQLTFVYSGTMT